MAIPLAVMIGAQVLGNVFNQMAAKRRFNAVQDARRAEQMRQLQRQDQARARHAEEAARFQPEAHQATQDTRTNELVEVLTNPEIDTSMLAPRLAYTAPTTGPTMVAETQERARARDEANKTGAALAASEALSDVFAGHGVNLGRSRQDLGSIGVAAQDSARVLEGFEIPRGMQEGQGLDFLGNVTKTAGNLASGYMAGRAGMPGAAGGPTAVSSSPGGFQWFPTAGHPGGVRKYF